MKWSWLSAGVVVAFLAGAAGWYVFGSPTESDVSATTDTALLRTGERVYAANCASCHGRRGQGQEDWRTRKPDGKLPAPPLNGEGHTWHHPDSHLRAVVTKGVEAMAPAGYESDMRGFKDKLSEREIRAVIAYLKDWWPAHARSRQQEITDRAASSE